MASRRNYASVYRIVSKKYPVFDGGGAQRWGSRWVSPGRRVVHAAQNYSLAVLENLVHWQSSGLPPSLVCVEAKISDSIEQEYLPRDELPEDMGNDYSAFREIGDDWYDTGGVAVFWVPSLVSPYETNVLINQAHPDFAKIRVSRLQNAPVDTRLLE